MPPTFPRSTQSKAFCFLCQLCSLAAPGPLWDPGPVELCKQVGSNLDLCPESFLSVNLLECAHQYMWLVDLAQEQKQGKWESVAGGFEAPISDTLLNSEPYGDSSNSWGTPLRRVIWTAWTNVWICLQCPLIYSSLGLQFSWNRLAVKWWMKMNENSVLN